ncbi:MAG: SDR family NAD(P)-dependent oxidoreductase, partial [Acidobacteria bacterium]|nr:SDR family NAD(P)-dependent oxidoreductase [Acidobacteriota bacterium]
DPNPNQEQLFYTHYTKEMPRAVFMFPGQGSQYVDMARGLYEKVPLFREEMDRCFHILQSTVNYSIKTILYPSPAPFSLRPIGSDKINQTEITQPLIFIIEYALSKLLMAWGIKPYAMIGHSIGEYTAACLSGVFSLTDALTVVACRGQLMQQMPEGSMYSVFISQQEIGALLIDEKELALAAVNGPAHCVVSGPPEAMDEFVKKLAKKGYQLKELHTSHAFHSFMMEPIVKNFETKIARVQRNQPRIPFISNVTGQWIGNREAVEPAYWARHLRETVRFADGLTELLKEKNSIFIEVGPSRTLSTFVQQHPDKQPENILINVLRHPNEEIDDEYYLTSKIGQIWLYGLPVDWQAYYGKEKRSRIHLPTYPFQRQQFRIEGNPTAMIREGIGGPHKAGKKARIEEWFYIPSWKRTVVTPERSGRDRQKQQSDNKRCLVFAGTGNFTTQLLKKLAVETENHLTVVRTGKKFSKHGPENGINTVYTIDPGKESDYETLIKELVGTADISKVPGRIVYLWNLSENKNSKKDENIEKCVDLGFYSLLYLARALGVLNTVNKGNGTWDIAITVLTDGMQQVWGEPVRRPEQAPVLGPVMVIPTEYRELPALKCRCIDIIIPDPRTGNDETGWLQERLIKELNNPITDEFIAYRGKSRLVRTFEPAPLAPVETPAPRLRQGGVYLITGGLGGIGLELARYLAGTVQAILILIGRSAFPDRYEWEKWLASHNSLDSVSRKIRKVKELESLGAQVQIYSVDITDTVKIQKVVQETIERFGTINGVIHAAGLPGGGVIQLKTREVADKILAPKVKGTLALNTALENIRLDFFVLCSSINSVLPIFGQVDYSAANAFLDAFSFYKNTVDKTFTVSINWDAWQKVGMATAPGPRLVDHPLFDHCSAGKLPNGRIKLLYTSFFSIKRHWILSGHRTREGKGLAPGVVYLEMVHAAIADYFSNENKNGNSSSKNNGVVEMRSVFFLNPLLVEADEEKEVRTILKQEGDGFEFLIRSRLKPGVDAWQNHARGHIFFAALGTDDKKIMKRDILEIQQKCSIKEIEAASQLQTEIPDSLIIFGPRWRNLKKISVGTKEGLALLELPLEFTNELNEYTLYPPLLDQATVFLYDQVNSDGESSRIYIPYSYKQLKVYRSLLAKVYCFSVKLGDGDGESRNEFLRFNITLMDEEGEILVEIEEFTMLEVSDAILGKLRKKENEREQGEVGSEEEMVQDGEEFIKDGILPWEGIEVFQRILAEEFPLPQVLVSTVELAPRIQALKNAGIPGLIENMWGNKPEEATHPRYERPDVSSAYAAPATEAEQKLATIWQELLGIGQVGRNDDFFELGGDSLKATLMVSKIKQLFNVNISVGEVFNYPHLRELIKQMAIPVEAGTLSSPIEPVEKRKYYPVSAMQKRMYILNSMEGKSTLYNLAFARLIEGKLDMRRIEWVAKLLIQRHESLRTSFDMIDGELVQVIHEAESLTFQVVYLEYPGSLDTPGMKKKIDELICGFIKPFELTKAPLVRLEVVKLADKKYLAIFDIHHIAADGTSCLIMIRDFETLYNVGSSDNKNGQLAELNIQYKDFSQYRNNPAIIETIRQQEAYWLEAFRGEIHVLNLPTDYPRPMPQSFAGDRVKFDLSGAEATRLKQMALAQGATLFMILLAVYNVLLSKLSGQEDIFIGIPIAGRRHVDLEPVIGMFVNSLALRNYPVGEKTFNDFLAEVRERTLGAFENQDYQFEDLVEKIGATRNMNRNPLFDVMFVLQNFSEVTTPNAGKRNKTDDLVITGWEYDLQTAKFDLTLEAFEQDGRLFFDFEYCTDLFKEKSIHRFVHYFKTIITSVINGPAKKIAEIDMLPEEERKQLLFDFNNTGVTFPGNITIPDLFGVQVEKAPDYIAVIGPKNPDTLHAASLQITYRQLNEQADGLAALLMKNGVGPDMIVAIMMKRCAEMIIGLLGILKSGGAYLPIDPEYPEDRSNYILKDSGAKLLAIANDQEGEKVRRWEGKKVLLESICHPSNLFFQHSAFDIPRIQHSNHHLAYIIYTSGSTGKPKGVMVEHRNLTAYLHAFLNEFALTPSDTSI